MKLSKIQQIIKEEVAKAMSEAVTGQRLEELPDYNELPTTNADVKKRDLTRAEVILRLEDSTVFSKEEAQEWRDDFKNRWMDNKEEPLFTYERKPLAGKEVVFAKVINSPKHAAVKSKGPGPGPEADLGDYYGPGAPRYTGD